MTRDQNVGAWTTFLSLVVDRKDLSQQSGNAGGSAGGVVFFVGDHPSAYPVDPRIPVPDVGGVDQ